MTTAETSDRVAWDVHEVARAVGVSASYIRKLTRLGMIPSVKLGHRRLYPVDKLREWINAQCEMKKE